MLYPFSASLNDFGVSVACYKHPLLVMKARNEVLKEFWLKLTPMAFRSTSQVVVIYLWEIPYAFNSDLIRCFTR